MAREGSLHPDTARVFRVDGQPIRFHRHQAQAIAKAAQRQSFAVTTGTGSGKSLCFFVPIIDAAIRARAAGEAARTRAIVIYPMNALANSQLKELEKFIEQSGLPNELRPTFARYTGQESQEERDRIKQAKPDILLTNFMMLELLMTRQSTLDRAVIANADGLDYIVLDELHTYRGRQGADVAMLVRRVRDRLCREHEPICIGTSATMVSEGSDAERAAAVANVASRLFGTTITADGVIDESLERATDPSLTPTKLGERLAAAVDADLSDPLDDGALRVHPLAVWIELEIGLEDGQRLSRRPPITIADAAKRLAAADQARRGALPIPAAGHAHSDEPAGERARRHRRSRLHGIQAASLSLRRRSPLSSVPPRQLGVLEGLEHGRTIPFSDISGAKYRIAISPTDPRVQGPLTNKSLI